MTVSSPISLERYFRGQATRWALIGFVVTLLLAVPCILYSAKLASERQVAVAAKSAARAFRPMVVQDDIRDAEFQMRKALELRPGESAVIRDADLNALYPLTEEDKTPRCRKPNSFCWGRGYHSVSLLYPIYYDTKHPDLIYCYLELTMRPTLDWILLGALVMLLFFAFIGQAFGLSWALSQSARQLVKQLSAWANHLRESPGSRPQENEVPFTELRSMQDAVDQLYLEIEKLREQTAHEAKTEGQFSLLREISHDLKTPHSLLAKYFAIHLDTLHRTGRADPNEVAKINSTLKRMGELIRQVRVIPLGKTISALADPNASCDIAAEARSIIEDLKNDPEAQARGITIEGQVALGTSAIALISPIGLYRILENLARNAIEAVEPKRGRVCVSVETIDGCPTLRVSDNGSGIAPEILDKILAFDFTTKPARGTGLGLGIVDKICKEFGATLRFDSEVGKDTSFTVTFKPAARTVRAQTDFGEVSYAQV